MRLDKFLQVSRLVKRRTRAKEICQEGRVTLNQRPAKPASEVKPGDVLGIDFGTYVLEVEVLATPEYARKEAAAGLYRVLEKKEKPLFPL